MQMNYLCQPPKRFTFEQPQLKRWVEQHSHGKVLNLFAGRTALQLDEVRVDKDAAMPADYHMDAFEFVQLAIQRSMKFDTVILDPPYNLRKAREKYGGKYIGKFTKLMDSIPFLVPPGGTVISLGYSSGGMGKCRGFEKTAICLVNHHGDHDDTIVVVERKANGSL